MNKENKERIQLLLIDLMEIVSHLSLMFLSHIQPIVVLIGRLFPQKIQLPNTQNILIFNPQTNLLTVSIFCKTS
jgi:hypothetical protein